MVEEQNNLQKKKRLGRIRNIYNFSVFSVMFTLLVSGLILLPAQASPETAGWVATPPLHIKGFATSSPTGLTPTQIRNAYGFDLLSCSFNATSWNSTNLCGHGQTIAIVDAFGDPNIASDLNTFSTQFNLPSCTTANGCFVKSTPQGNPVFNSGWALETSLDVEWIHAIAPGAKILLVESINNGFTPLFGAVDNASATSGVHQVSMSWGGPEFSSETSFDSHFQRSGVSFFASSGDSGHQVEYPAGSPYVISTGGTTLHPHVSETAWSGSGGGISAFEVKPSYQNHFQKHIKRGVPDVSYDADPSTGVPVYDSNGCASACWIQVGGTSAAAPQWAALFAIVNSGRAVPISSLSFGSEKIIYSAATGNTIYHQDYRDITTGSNGGCGFICNAKVKYDFVTGLGSPLANNLVHFLQTH